MRIRSLAPDVVLCLSNSSSNGSIEPCCLCPEGPGGLGFFGPSGNLNGGYAGRPNGVTFPPPPPPPPPPGPTGVQGIIGVIGTNGSGLVGGTARRAMLFSVLSSEFIFLQSAGFFLANSGSLQLHSNVVNPLQFLENLLGTVTGVSVPNLVLADGIFN